MKKILNLNDRKTKYLLLIMIAALIACLLFLSVKYVKLKNKQPAGYRYDGKKITSEYKIVGSREDFKKRKNGDGSFSIAWAASGKYDFEYCYVIPPLTEFGFAISSVDSIGFDENCKEVYFADGCYPIYESIGGVNIDDVYVSSSVTFIESIGGRNIHFSNKSYMARSPQISDGEKTPDNRRRTEIIFPDNMYEIYGVAGLEKLKRVHLPENLRNIMMSFNDCDSLEEIDIPYVMFESIYASFINCKSLKNVNIVFGVKYIMSSFSNCPKLEDVYIPKKTVIGEGSFMGCPNLTLKVHRNSPAEEYAIANDIKFEYCD